MKIHRLGSSIAALALLPLGGCVPMQHKWTEVQAPDYSQPTQGYAAALPHGWIEISSPDNSGTIVSRHGPDLDNIRITRVNNDKAFPVLKKSAAPDEQPADLAQDLVAEFKNEAGDMGLQIITNEPVQVGGKNGVHLLLEYGTSSGVHYRMEDYAVCTPDGFYQLRYQAPVLRYFDLSEPAFKATVASFHFIPKTAR
ncbi:MAG: PsbP-related protein [Bacillota bacterium]